MEEMVLSLVRRIVNKKVFEMANRRDQIWFVQKDQYGYSELSLLSDFRIRTDTSFENDYLAGVYGWIQLIGEFQLREE